MKLDMTSRSQIPAYLNSLGYDGFGLEVGVLRGDFSKTLLQGCNIKKLYLVDSWSQNGNIDLNNGDHNTQLSNFADTFKNVYEFGSRAIIVRDSSEGAASLFKDGSLDFVYLDAGHDFKSVNDDIGFWWPKVREGGMLFGDDYIDGMLLFNGLTVFEVRTAVDEWAASIGKEVMYSHPAEGELTNPQWYVKK